MSTGGIVLVALVIAVGLIGIVVPLLPGTLLVFGAIAVWAVVEHDVTAWVTLGVVAALLAVFVAPSGVMRMLPGFKSRWTIPSRCASAMARASPSIILAASQGGRGMPSSRSARLPPATYSISM